MKRQILAAVLGLLVFAHPVRADVSGGIDWSAWQRMPVLQDGRIMPLDSFARAEVKKICGDVRPTLGMLGSKTNAEMRKLSAEDIKRLANEGRPRQFLAAELLYGWTVEPEKWDDVPFLLCDDETLRSDVLDAPLVGEDGSRLKYVSPRQVRQCKKLGPFVAEIEAIKEEAEKKRKKPDFSALQEKVIGLLEAYGLFVDLSYDPSREGQNNRFLESDFAAIQDSWKRLDQALKQGICLAELASNIRDSVKNEEADQLAFQKVRPSAQAAKLEQELHQLAENVDQSMHELDTVWTSIQTEGKPIQEIEPVLASLRRATAELDAKMQQIAATELPDPAILIKDDVEDLRYNRQVFTRWTRELALQTAQLHWSVYSEGEDSVNLVPSLETTSLEADRFRSEIHPWISLHALLHGSSGLLQGYPSSEVEKVRTAWGDAQDAYFSRGSAAGANRFAAAIEQFTLDVRGLSEAIEPDRLRLPIVQRDQGLLAKTAYPQPIVTDAEVLYNRVDPFFWSGCASLAAACILGLSFITLRKLLFWSGIATMVAGVALIVGGFLVRMYITHWAPVTSMFETIVWVGMVVSLLTLWVTFLPLLGPTSKVAWGLTAIPGSWEDKRRRAPAVAEPVETSQAGIRTFALALRLVLFLAGLYVSGIFQPVSVGGDYRLASIMPCADLGSSMPNSSSSLVWAASMFVTSMFVWYLPRIIPSVLFAIPMSLALAGRDTQAGADRMEKIYRWRIVPLFGAVASFLAALAALYAPFPRDIQALNPVLRSNFWLGIHVLTITSSYAAVGVSWMIGNLALGYFAFGQYVDTERGRRPPAFCGTLASLNYRVLQVAVLLLTAGTILGGLWADVSWGRFWGWDPKEVGALIALLFIMTALHGRRAGWPGDLSLAIGSIFGFGGVIWAWYVVNFILKSGKHAYGGDEIGQLTWLIAVASAQALFMAVAIARVKTETGKRPAADIRTAKATPLALRDDGLELQS